MTGLFHLVSLAQLFQLCEWILLRSRHIVLWIFHSASVVLLYNLTPKIWTGNQRVAEGRTAGILKDAVSFCDGSIAVGQIDTLPWSWEYLCIFFAEYLIMG